MGGERARERPSEATPPPNLAYNDYGGGIAFCGHNSRLVMPAAPLPPLPLSHNELTSGAEAVGGKKVNKEAKVARAAVHLFSLVSATVFGALSSHVPNPEGARLASFSHSRNTCHIGTKARQDTEAACALKFYP